MAEHEFDLSRIKDNSDEQRFGINTGKVYWALQKQWKRYDRAFLVDDVQEALSETLYQKKVFRKLTDKDEDRHYELFKASQTYTREGETLGNNPDVFPFQSFSFVKDKGREEIIDFETDCPVTLTDRTFMLLFFLQLSLTDILEVQAFLDYHFRQSFSEDAEATGTFLSNGLKNIRSCFPRPMSMRYGASSSQSNQRRMK